MSHVSVLFQTTDSLNINNVVHCGSLARACEFLGVSAGVHSPGLTDASLRWLGAYGARLHDSAVEDCEVLFRAFGIGSFPPRPAAPRQLVVDMALFASWLSGDADYGLAFYDGGAGAADSVMVNVVAPLPQELGPVFRNVTSKKAVVFLGTDPLGRGPGIADAIAGLGHTASAISLPDPPDFWTELMTADVAVCSPGVPHLTATCLGVPTIVVANVAEEDLNMLEVQRHGLQGWEYIGPLSSLSDAQVRTQARDLMRDLDADTAKRYAMSALGLATQRKVGTRRISEWIARSLIGTRELAEPLFSFPVWPNRRAIPNPGGF